MSNPRPNSFVQAFLNNAIYTNTNDNIFTNLYKTKIHTERKSDLSLEYYDVSSTYGFTRYDQLSFYATYLAEKYRKEILQQNIPNYYATGALFVKNSADPVYASAPFDFLQQPPTGAVFTHFDKDSNTNTFTVSDRIETALSCFVVEQALNNNDSVNALKAVNYIISNLLPIDNSLALYGFNGSVVRQTKFYDRASGTFVDKNETVFLTKDIVLAAYALFKYLNTTGSNDQTIIDAAVSLLVSIIRLGNWSLSFYYLPYFESNHMEISLTSHIEKIPLAAFFKNNVTSTIGYGPYVFSLELMKYFANFYNSAYSWLNSRSTSDPNYQSYTLFKDDLTYIYDNLSLALDPNEDLIGYHTKITNMKHMESKSESYPYMHYITYPGKYDNSMGGAVVVVPTNFFLLKELLEIMNNLSTSTEPGEFYSARDVLSFYASHTNLYSLESILGFIAELPKFNSSLLPTFSKYYMYNIQLFDQKRQYFGEYYDIDTSTLSYYMALLEVYSLYRNTSIYEYFSFGNYVDRVSTEAIVQFGFVYDQGQFAESIGIYSDKNITITNYNVTVNSNNSISISISALSNYPMNTYVYFYKKDNPIPLLSSTLYLDKYGYSFTETVDDPGIGNNLNQYYVVIKEVAESEQL